MSRTPIERDIGRRVIINAAKKLFSCRGAERVSMEEIAKASKYTRRTLYHYFSSYDEIILSILTEDLRTRWNEQKEELKKGKSGLDKVIKWAESFYAYTVRNPFSIKVQLYWDFKGINKCLINETLFKSFESINNELAERLQGIFKLGIRDGSIRPDLKVDIYISQFLYSLRAVINRALSSSYSFASFEIDEYVNHHLDIIARSIGSCSTKRNEEK